MDDEERSGRPSICTDDPVELVRERIMENRRFAIMELSSHFPQISRTLLHKIVMEPGAALEGSSKLAIPPKILKSMMRVRN